MAPNGTLSAAARCLLPALLLAACNVGGVGTSDDDSLTGTDSTPTQGSTGSPPGSTTPSDSPGSTATDPPTPTPEPTPTPTPTPTPPPAPVCSLPPLYERVVHVQGAVDFKRVAWAPDGGFALLLGDRSSLFRYDPATGDLTLEAGPPGEVLSFVRFSEDGSYAFIGGHSTSGTSPVLHTWTETGGLQPVASVTGLGDGKLPDPGRLADAAQRPGTDTWALLSDNGGSWPSQISYINQLVPDLNTGAHAWSFHGAVNTSQGASSIDWGTNLGLPIALANSRYLELIRFEPLLASNQVTIESTPNHGNLKKVAFNPADRSRAWVMQWSGQGAVYSWEGVLRNTTGEKHSFTGWSMWDFAVSADGAWTVFVGRNGNIWFADSPFRPVDSGRFYNHPIPSFDQPPWSGNSNLTLMEAAWRPGTCEGLIVASATAGMGLVVRFELQ